MKTFVLLTLVLLGAATGFAAAPEAKPKPELPKTGMNLARDDGGWINVEVQGVSFVVSFYNARMEPVLADVHHGLVRYAYIAKSRDRSVLTLTDDGMKLTSPSDVKPPHVFRVHLALFNQDPDDLAETFAFSYNAD